MKPDSVFPYQGQQSANAACSCKEIGSKAERYETRGQAKEKGASVQDAGGAVYIDKRNVECVEPSTHASVFVLESFPDSDSTVSPPLKRPARSPGSDYPVFKIFVGSLTLRVFVPDFCSQGTVRLADTCNGWLLAPFLLHSCRGRQTLRSRGPFAYCVSEAFLEH